MSALFGAEQQWAVLDSYFKSHTYAFTKHHIDSYREFLRNYIPSTIRTFNPITMIKLDSKGDPILSVKIFVGGEKGDAIYIDRPTMIDNNNIEVLLTPAEARLRNLTYEGHLYADIYIQYELANDVKVQTTKFEKVLLGAIPLMVHSDACILNGQGPDVLRELGECIYDTGGYFIIDGKEKVIVSQERIANNKLFIEKIEDDTYFSHRAYIKCVGQIGESKLAPRGFEIYVANDMKTYEKKVTIGDDEETDDTRKKSKEFINNALYISFPSLRGKVPLFLLFRALGIETDRQIVETIFGKSEIPHEYVKYIRASIIASHTISCFTQEDALNYMQYRVQYQITEYVKNILVTDVFPNIDEQKNKPIYLGFLVKDLLDACLNIHPPTDRDAYTTKRIDISGFQLAELFQEVYMILRKNCRDNLDREYNLGPWRNNGNARITTLVRKDNIYKLFPPAILTDRFVRSLKGMWGSTDADPEQGKVQDVSRISYLGYLSHMRRINLPLDRSRRNVPPHRLHSQQWGMFCPFETPDGQSIGLLKNFALMAYVTFGTKLETIQDKLPQFGIIPLSETTTSNITNSSVCKVMLNGTWYGISYDPVYHTRLLKAFRRNGYINPFVSISWNITKNILHIQTDPGRMCRPLFIVKNKQIMMPLQRDRDKSFNWFNYLFGDGGSYLNGENTSLSSIYYTEEMYYKDAFILPSWWSDPMTVKERVDVIMRLEKSEGCIEYLDVDEENTCMIAMNATDLTNLDKNIEYTHCEIHPCTAFSVVTNTIPFANHNYAARNLFHGAQAKQTVGVYATNFKKRFDTMSYVMHYPQKPLVTTKTAHYIAANNIPNGFNAIVAIATNTGYNQEDGVIINKAAIERGLFHTAAFKTMTASEKIISPSERLQFRNPYTPIDILINHGISDSIIEVIKKAGYKTLEDVYRTNDAKFVIEGITSDTKKTILEKVKQIKEIKKDPVIQGIKSSDYYELLDENGIIREESKISRGSKMIVMSMVHIREEHREVSRGIISEIEKVKHYRDVSRMTDVHHYGVVDKIFMGTKALGSSDRICKVRFRKIRKPELGDKTCLTPDHDVLTSKGWKSIDKITKQDEVYVLKADGSFGYEKPVDLTVKECVDEILYDLHSQQVDLCVTQDHNMWVKKRGKTIYERIPSKDIIGKRVSYAKSAINTNSDYQIVLPAINKCKEKHLDMDAFLEFFGYWIGEGWSRVTTRQRPNRKIETTDYIVEVIAYKKEDKERVIQLVNQLGYTPIRHGDDKIQIASRQLTEFMRPLSVGAPHKYLPDWVWNLSQRQVQKMYEGMRRGDGSVGKSGSDSYYTSSIRLANDIQRLALHAGWSANINIVHDKGHTVVFKDKKKDADGKIIIKERTVVSKYDNYRINIVKSKNNPMINHGHIKTQNGQKEQLIKYTGKVYCFEVPSHVFYVRRNGKPVWTGNCSRHGQKGVIGMIVPERDMPMTKDGIIPDIIINPHALPSRMTIAHLVECIFSKSCCFDGMQGDGTMFIPVDYDVIGLPLEKRGFNKYGNEIMYDGRTGKQIETDIFIGPTFYYRLKHMVADKVHARGGNPSGLSRSDLPYEQLTRQPTEGRAKNGGLRVGEMERDVILSYGMSQFSKESIMDRSDKYRYAVCRYCGIVSSPMEYGSSASICMNCKRSDVSIIETPYAWKLLVQEFEALGVQLRFVTDSIDEFYDYETDEDEDKNEKNIPNDFEIEAETIPDDELGGEYDHNPDLDEPAVYGIQAGGTIDALDLDLLIEEPVKMQEDHKENHLSDSHNQITESSEEKPYEVLSEPLVKNVSEKPYIEQFGGNMILDLEDNNVDDNVDSSFFTDISSQKMQLPQQHTQIGGNTNTNDKQNSDIKVIEIGTNINKYKSKGGQIDNDYTEERIDNDYTEETGDDFFS